MKDLHLLTAADFREILNQTIYICFTPEVTLPAEVVEVTELGGYSPAERTPFSLVVRTQQTNIYYTQGVYAIEHPVIGALSVFLVPLGLDGKGMRYEAVFS